MGNGKTRLLEWKNHYTMTKWPSGVRSVQLVLLDRFSLNQTGRGNTFREKYPLPEHAKKKFLPSPRKHGINISKVWFQQDGATPHISGAVLTWLRSTFGDRFISYRTNHVWPLHSPDLNQLDFFLLGYLKDKVYSPRHENLQDPKTAIRREVFRIKVGICEKLRQKALRRHWTVFWYIFIQLHSEWWRQYTTTHRLLYIDNNNIGIEYIL